MSAGKNKEKLVYAAGVFDFLHYGHVRYLESAKRLGDVLIVGLVDDEGVSRYKHRKPLLKFEHRWETVRALKCVDYIVRQNDTDPTETLKILDKEHGWKIDILVRGTDFKGIPPGSRYMKNHGGKVVRIPYCSEISSTRLKEHYAPRG